jgi:hypothetical protein
MLDVSSRFFVDESCHLENDKKPIMCVGQIKVLESGYEQCKAEIKEIKKRHYFFHEIKWSKVSIKKINFYKEIIDYFFDNTSLEFRSVLVKYKEKLNHSQFNQGSHDNFYYKMIYYLLYNPYVINYSNEKFAVYLDIKDTRGRQKLKKLDEVFNNKFLGENPFKHLQHIKSHDSVFIQLADLFIGAIAYKSQGLVGQDSASPAKKEVIDYLEFKSGYNLHEGTEPAERKFNIFDHQPREVK